MITVTTKKGDEFKYEGHVIIFQNDYNILQIMWDKYIDIEEMRASWQTNGCDWFYINDIHSVRGE